MKAIMTLDEFKRIDFSKKQKIDIEITPEIAKWILEERNTINRKIKKNFVEQIENDMKEGHWNWETWEPIRFDEEGYLIDGQHRLEGIVNSEQTYTFMCVFGLPRRSILDIDIGPSRTSSDSFKIAGSDNLLCKRTGIAFVKYVIMLVGGYSKNKKYTRNQVETMYITHKKSFDSIYTTATGYKNKFYKSTALAAMLCMIANGVKLDAVKAFMECGANNVKGKEKYNVKAALDAAQHMDGSEDPRQNICYYIEQFYKFYNDVRSIRVARNYDISTEKLDALESRLRGQADANGEQIEIEM